MENSTKQTKNEKILLNFTSYEPNEFPYIKRSNKKRPNSESKHQINNNPKYNVEQNLKFFKSINSISTSNLLMSNKPQKTTINDFDIIAELGQGAYAKVILAKNKNNGKQYAIKRIKKDLMNYFEKDHEIFIERYCLSNLTHPNIIKLCKAFQDKNYLYFVLEYCKNKDLNKLLLKFGKLNFRLAQYYAAEIISVISFMHKKGIYHRDLKPENIGIDEDMHLKLIDFGTANSIYNYFDKKTKKFVFIDKKTFEEAKLKNEKISDNVIKVDKYNIVLLNEQKVGTAEYMSPEVLENNYDIIGPMVDIWAFGVTLYKFFYGKTPFKGENDNETYENIKNMNYSFDEENNNNSVPKNVKDLIKKILIKDPKKRLGYNSIDFSYNEIKSHPFFKGICFDTFEDEPAPLNKIYSTLENYGYILPIRDNSKKAKGDIYQNVLYKSQLFFDDNLSIGSADNGYMLGITKKKSSNSLSIFKSNFIGDTNENDLNGIDNLDNYLECEEEYQKKQDEVLIEDILYKKSPWYYYKARIVKLFSNGRIDYFDVLTKSLKGSIYINENSQANAIDDFRFEIITGERIYTFKHNIKRVSDNWVEKIKNIIMERIYNLNNRHRHW